MALRASPLAARLGRAAPFVLVSLLLGASLLASANAHAAKLTVAKRGSGTVTSAPSGINCGATCSANYANGTSVTLTASPATGYSFSGWGGACSGTSATCTVSMTRSRRVSASFSQNVVNYYTLTVSKSGSGTVTSAPSGINCGTTCSASYASGTSVTLTASAASGYNFTGWSGACSGTSTTCTVAMTAARSVTATFSQNVVNYYSLTVSKGGAGTITSAPAGINCGTTCSASYASGTGVTLTASPATGYNFSGWGGACSGTSASCTVSMTSSSGVTATFSQNVASYQCSSGGLAATDLAGQCRASPPTMGALEAIDPGALLLRAIFGVM
jgi:uncharacterized repeat protein (TIGR02543 family)